MATIAHEARKMTERIPTDPAILAKYLRGYGIPSETIGFYNLESYRQDDEGSGHLDLYAVWVRQRPRDRRYDAQVREIVARLVEIVDAEIASDGEKGMCRPVCNLLVKMLELRGVWCYVAEGALTIENPALEKPIHFPLFGKEATGHCWVVAPPYEIVDLTLGHQILTEEQNSILPRNLLLEDPPRTSARDEDFCLPGLLAELRSRHTDLHADRPGLALSLERFPSFEVQADATRLRYAAGGVVMPDAASLYQLDFPRLNGRKPGRLYDQLVRQALDGRKAG
jgi:hypothetical protein